MQAIINKQIRAFVFFLAVLSVTANVYAAKLPGSDINPKEIIFEHIQDAYWWHITTINEHHISVYLPVIIYSSSSGWNIFMSSHLEHGHKYMGFYIPGEGRYAGKIVETAANGAEIRPVMDISVTKTALAMLINSAVMLVIFLSVAGWYRRKPGYSAPGGFVGTMEMFVMSIEDDLIRESIGKDYARYSPYLLTAFFFIFINNIMGLIPVFPGGANVTGNIAVTLVLALCTMLAVNLFGNKEYWREILWPDVPLWMKAPFPLMPLIELFGVISKPFALTIRLFANITAGHAVILALTCLVFITVKMGTAMNVGMTVFSVILSVFMSFMEILVAYIQAYVFTMLSAVFIGLSRQEHEDKRTGKKFKTT
ncbi:MAG: F0F1 ATP synthase subunit A [Tannerella sp.]|jgi:F-type H+-transporting ATPase subunit a|nr:F0F1 ATP synthase subunit A [Tannerella sp.]